MTYQVKFRSGQRTMQDIKMHPYGIASGIIGAGCACCCGAEGAAFWLGLLRATLAAFKLMNAVVV